MSDGGGCYLGEYSGTACAWFIQPPQGYIVKLEFDVVDIFSRDHIYVDTSSDINGSLLSVSSVDKKWLSGHITNRAQEVKNTSVFYSDYGRPILVLFSGANASRGGARGFVAQYEMIPRLQLMVDAGVSTNLQFALAILERQEVNFSAIVAFSAVNSQEELFSGGKGRLGPLSDAERCFLCSWDFGLGYQPGAPPPTALPVFSVVPPPQALGLDLGYDFNVPVEVAAEEIPPAVASMGYAPAHFVRTGYVSRYPPGTIKAPATGKPLGPIPAWGPLGDTDPSVVQQPIREKIGWGLEPVYKGSWLEWFSSTPYGWGWDDGYAPQGMGELWRSGSGANDNDWPDWQVLQPVGGREDAPRLAYDLETSSVPLFSFVDGQRRIVLANELALSAPCGVPVNDTCGLACGGVLGTGLNLQQCLANASATPCGAPVVDACHNDCGLRGTGDCQGHATAFSALRVHTLGGGATASYALTVGKPGSAVDDALYLSFQDAAAEGVDIAVLDSLDFHLVLNVTDGFTCNIDCLVEFASIPANRDLLELILNEDFFAFSNESNQTSYPRLGDAPWPSCSALTARWPA